MNLKLGYLFLGVALALAGQKPAGAQGTAFTYQGQLSQNGAPAEGAYDLRFTIHDAATGGSQVGQALTNSPMTVSAGNVSVRLDFGPGIFAGPSRWLEVGVRSNGSASAYVTLAPRQPISAAPYAIHSLTASNLLGTIREEQLPATIPRLNNAASFSGAVAFNPLFGPPFSINSSNRVPLLNADLLDNLDGAAFARSNHTHSAAEIAAGTLSDARLSPNVAMLPVHQVFLASNRFAGAIIATNRGNLFAGNGAGLTNLSAGNLSGVIPASAIPLNLPRLGSNQTFTGVTTFAPVAGAPFRVGNSTLVSNLNADQLDGVSAAGFWHTAGNSNAATLFLGTLDDSPVELRANNSRALRLLPHPLGATLIAGHPGNSASANAAGATVGGGSNNSVSNAYSFVAAGSRNRATGPSSSVGGGDNNAATNTAAVVPGGTGNIAGGLNSFAAGAGAQAIHPNAFVWADGSSAAGFASTAANQALFRAAGGVGIGTNNPQSALHVAGAVQASGLRLTTGPQIGAILVSDAAGNAAWQEAPVRGLTNTISPNVIGGHLSNSVAAGIVGATIAGGGALDGGHHIAANYGTIGGGSSNAVTGTAGVVSGGEANRAANRGAVVSGGLANVAGGTNSTVGGGQMNQASGSFAMIGGGRTNQASGLGATVAGGVGNLSSGSSAFVGGGQTNRATGTSAAVAGGDRNSATGVASVVGGGLQNTNTGSWSVIGGGRLNRATNDYAVVAGGENNLAGGVYSFAAGRRAQAVHPGSFVWADFSSTADFASTAANQFLIRAAGGVGIGTAPQDAMLDVEGDTHVNDFDIFLRGGSDQNNGLGWSGTGKLFAGQALNGPALYGFNGGALGSRGSGSESIALRWDSRGRVGIGTNAPASALHVMASDPFAAEFVTPSDLGTVLRIRNSGDGGREWRLLSTGSASPGGAGQFQIWDGVVHRLSLDNNGSVGIGTTTPGAKLELFGADTTLNIRNQNDSGVGGFIQRKFQRIFGPKSS